MKDAKKTVVISKEERTSILLTTEQVHEILRKAVGAPEHAEVDFDMGRDGYMGEEHEISWAETMPEVTKQLSLPLTTPSEKKRLYLVTAEGDDGKAHTRLMLHAGGFPIDGKINAGPIVSVSLITADQAKVYHERGIFYADLL